MADKKIYVATYYDWFSFGAQLQAMSFNHFLRENGYDAKLIDYQHQDLDIKRSRSLKSVIKNILLLAARRKARSASERFMNENVARTAKIKVYRELEKLDKEDSVFIAGSDQIWDPTLCSDFFFLRFVSKGKRASYAASMGKTNVPASVEEKFFDYVRGMEKISVREDDVQRLLNEKGIDSEVHVDPVFLHDKEFWKKYEQAVGISGKYILLFPIYWDEKLNDEIRRIKKETGLPVYSLSSSGKVFSDKVLNGVTASEFLYLIDHAEKIVTSSFHGTAFSLIFKKEFCAVVDPSKPSRISSLLKKFGAESAICGEKIVFASPSVYSNGFDKTIENETEKSLSYIKEVIGI